MAESLCLVSARDYALHWTPEERMRSRRCEATGLKVKANADGRATCPLCGDDWHTVTRTGRLAFHTRSAHRDLTPQEIEERLEAAQRKVLP